MKAEPLIINRPERQKPLQRATFALITMIAWTFWVSLWLPLLTLIAWLLGLQDIYIKLGLGHPFQAVENFDLVLGVACVCALSLGAWAFYNRMRFAGKQRRHANRVIDVHEMAPALAASVDTASQLRVSRRSTIYFTEHGSMFLNADGS
ncbi:poly-beta-1,6-N-acetyl-D-glucosamine biosynthesis protein PgaD [Dyella psychrodurans]|uniref:Poly-beta-1,6-N-acetyl-D-glucosamine biosynthesis protein PgaD n=1 Tax=Dyella psychrodurans TaxID=1927960 RepID=A0A370XDR8_9GAMM|nr:poly-beta-1,6-N-acetyl-D-glucosamine biosynthesis protein PgaD [Dyella psychrodurans]RDS86573.1 poly-beta-1,6-N-acetyl-D-glucosamine biosynthesis protein PgaD [Dyella psychrodurans]